MPIDKRKVALEFSRITLCMAFGFGANTVIFKGLQPHNFRPDLDTAPFISSSLMASAMIYLGLSSIFKKIHNKPWNCNSSMVCIFVLSIVSISVLVNIQMIKTGQTNPGILVTLGIGMYLIGVVGTAVYVKKLREQYIRSYKLTSGSEDINLNQTFAPIPFDIIESFLLDMNRLFSHCKRRERSPNNPGHQLLGDRTARITSYGATDEGTLYIPVSF